MRPSRTGSRRYLLEDVFERDRAAGVGPLLEAAKCLIELETLQADSLLRACTRERMTAGVLAERQRHANADRFGIHDLVRPRVLQHPVLVDAGLVREGVGADDGLVRRHHIAGGPRDEARSRRDLPRIEPCLDAEVLGADVERHDDLLERGVPRTLAEAVDRALDLLRAGLHT